MFVPSVNIIVFTCMSRKFLTVENCLILYMGGSDAVEIGTQLRNVKNSQYLRNKIYNDIFLAIVDRIIKEPVLISTVQD